MVDAAYAIVALPLAGFVVNLVWGRRLGEPAAGWVGTAAATGAFVAALVAWVAMLGRPASERVADLGIFTWFPVASLHAEVGLLVDPLSMTMALFVTGVSAVIHMYSVGYMHRDPGFDRFFVYLNLFVFSMAVLVLGDNFVFSFLGWEGVGFCSYALIGFWFRRDIAAVAANKAFFTNRVGDFGFLVAIFLIFTHFRSVSYAAVLGTLVHGHATGLLAGRAGAIDGTTATAITVLLFMGAVGKSAQIPLYIWLPDAMEGPTPISALIHAATMVTAGVYLMARVAPLLHYAPATSWLVASVGTGSAFLAASIACAQDDIKKALAYSTISQLGYMFMAEGARDYTDGLFHMLTHAFFKALLFLAAGAVIHALADRQDMKQMGGLGKYLPVTTVTFGVAWLSISGIPPFSGFWSKDAVLASVWGMNKGLWAFGVLTAGLTGYYMSRQFALVFTGQARWDEARPASEASHPDTGPGLPPPPHGEARPHDASWVMTVPLVILGVASFLGGGIDFPFWHLDFLHRFLQPMFGSVSALPVGSTTKWWLSVVTTAVALVGLGLGLVTWRSARHPRLEPAFLRRAWYFDDSVAATVSGPLRAGASALAFVMDRQVVDGIVNATARFLGRSGQVMRLVQNGYLRAYAIAFGLGVIAILAYVTFRVG